MSDRFHQMKMMNNMTFGGELDMVQDPLSENLFRQTKTYGTPTTVTQMASTAMPVVHSGVPKMEDKWIENSGSGRKWNSTRPGKEELATAMEMEMDYKGMNRPTDFSPTIAIRDRAKSEMIYRPAVLLPPKTYRYSVTSWAEKTSSLAGDIDMRNDAILSQAPDVSRPFVSRLPTVGVRKTRYPVNDYVPKRHKAKIVVWADLTVDAVDRLNESLNAEHIKQVLADIFVLDNYKDSLKMGIVMDLYFYTLQFARNQAFSPEKTSTFFSIIKKVFEVCIETPFGNLDHTFEYFKDLIHCHSVNRPPYSIELFSPDEVRKITEYTINTFFRHFKMYKYAFTPLVRLDLGIKYEGMPPTPPPSEVEPLDTETTGADDEQKEGEAKEEIDEERQAAREELKNMVKNFLTTESKKIEGTVDQQVKAAVDALSNKIDQMTDATPKAEGKGKKK